MILKNIEIKAKINNFDKLKELVENLCQKPIETENQEDTFFNSQSGRLKLRLSDSGKAELIHYNRKDSIETKQSDIAISFTDNPDTLKDVLSKSLGIRGVVKKKRTLYKYAQTRIHLDNVDGLGKFIELEVVMKPNQTLQNGKLIANELMEKFNIQKSDLIDVAYIDLVEINSLKHN